MSIRVVHSANCKEQSFSKLQGDAKKPKIASGYGMGPYCRIG